MENLRFVEQGDEVIREGEREKQCLVNLIRYTIQNFFFANRTTENARIIIPSVFKLIAIAMNLRETNHGGSMNGFLKFYCQHTLQSRAGIFDPEMS